MNDPVPTRWPHDPAEAWLAYEPSAADPWDLAKVLRLHHRAGFGATWAEAQRDVSEGYDVAISRVLAGAPVGPDGRSAQAIDDFAGAMSDSYRSAGGTLEPTRTIWFYRMVFGAWPLVERMTLAWHTHYATSETKVYRKETLVKQHQTQRTLWRSRASALHLAMLHDEAMLYWLDGAQNRHGAPNENLAREFLELFALGVGNFAEQDVRETARALTGWQRIFERDPELKYVPALHDPDAKVILGQNGAWSDEDVVRIVCSHPAAARRIAWRLWRTFVSDVDEPPAELLEGLAAAMRVEGDVDVARGVEVLLRSRLFHSAVYAGRRVPSPVEWMVSVLRAGETFPPRPKVTEIIAATERMGQRLFRPPNVAGWPGGLEWLTGPAIVARQNFAVWLTSAQSQVPADHWDQLVARHKIGPGEAELDFWTALFWGRTTAGDERGRLLAQFDPTKGEGRASGVRALLCAPEAQIC